MSACQQTVDMFQNYDHYIKHNLVTALIVTALIQPYQAAGIAGLVDLIQVPLSCKRYPSISCQLANASRTDVCALAVKMWSSVRNRLGSAEHHKTIPFTAYPGCQPEEVDDANVGVD